MLTIKNLSKSFGNHKIFNSLTISLEKGSIYALMGANGSGKTTLFNILTGFLKPDSGEIEFKNSKLNTIAPYKINRLGISRTFQDLRLIDTLTVRENVLLSMPKNPTDNWLKALLPKRFNQYFINQLEQNAHELLAKFYLEEVQNQLASEISYGQQKLLTLACSVANKAQFLLLDEPVAGINPAYRKKISELLKNLKVEGKTILLIEHHTEFIQEVADQCLFLYKGQLQTFDSFDKLQKNPTVLEAYLSPQPNQ